jgi:hypothetical protein
LKILSISPQPTEEQAAAIAAALAKLSTPAAIEPIRPSKWVCSGRILYPTLRPHAIFELVEPTKWLAAARTDALDDAL